MRHRSFAGLSALILLLGIGGNGATAGPVLCDSVPGVPVTPDGRVFPEPESSVSFVSFQEFQCGIDKLEQTYPTLIEQRIVGTSENGHPIFDILLTDETVSASKRKLLVVNSIHGNEPGGREGAVRVIEDMVDPSFLANETWVQEVLDEFVIHFLFPNPDGWVNGDISGDARDSAAATRGNGNGKDLNRQMPVQGYIYTPNTTLSEPEGNGILENMFGGGTDKGWYLGTDNHGQGPDTYAAAGLQIVGQFDYQKSETLARFADDIDDAMAEYGVLEDLQTIKDETGQDMGPYHWGTLYDMLGYSASGSLIDWYNTPGLVEGTGFATELTVGSEFSQAAFPQALGQVWVDSIRAINYTMFKHAIDPKTFTFEVGGKVAYVNDPDVIRHDDANGAGYERKADETIPQQPYNVSRMRFFEDLNGDATRPIQKVKVRQILRPKNHPKRLRLRKFDSLVLANDPMPTGGKVKRYYRVLRSWVERGGNLLLTDAAVNALPQMGLIPQAAIDSVGRYVGYLDFGDDRSHELEANLRGVASQTYDSVPIGYAFPPAGENCPVWRVDRATWEQAGGLTAGTNDDDKTAYGQLPVGKGMVRFIGALLPDPTEAFYHPYGLQNYAVTYTGYTLLQNSLRWENPARDAKPASPHKGKNKGKGKG